MSGLFFLAYLNIDDIHAPKNLVLLPSAPHNEISSAESAFWEYWGGEIGCTGKPRSVIDCLSTLSEDKNKQVATAYKIHVAKMDAKYGKYMIKSTSTGEEIISAIRTSAVADNWGRSFRRSAVELGKLKNLAGVALKFAGVFSGIMIVKELAAPGSQAQKAFAHLEAKYTQALSQFERLGYVKQQTKLDVVDSAASYMAAVGADGVLIYPIVVGGYIETLA